MHRLSPPPMKVTVVQTGSEGELDEDWCSHLTRELTRHLGFGAVREMVMDYSPGQPWTVAMELSSGNYGPNIEARIRSSVDWILENYRAEMMGGPGDDPVSGPDD
ncbi:MAG TPA: hypothetical protein VFJ84_01600 [Candidatus Saccharimonadales bacterium]|nr:hypothetical protein [Candidatus Saccharimonadales bacterium]